MRKAPLSLTDETRRLLIAALVVSVCTVAAAAGLFWTVYSQTLDAERKWLAVMVQNNARFMTAVFEDVRNDGDAAAPAAARERALDRIVTRLQSRPDVSLAFGRTGRLFLAMRRDGAVRRLAGVAAGAAALRTVDWRENGRGEPIFRALAGETGTLVGRNLRGREVVAAFTFVEGLQAGLVAEIDLAELQSPILRLGALYAAATALVAILGVWLMNWLTKPLIARLKDGRRRLESQKLALQRSNEDLEQFAYIASHDLKAPLRAIQNLTQWLAEDLEGALTVESGRHLAMLKGRAARMQDLLDGLLSYSRVGRKTAQPERVSCAALMRDVIAMTDLPEGFRVEPPCNAPSFMTEKAPLELVLRNLIGNAVKHHDRDRGLIRIAAELRDDAALFTVADDGPGVPCEFHERIFRIFQTLKPRDEVEANGLGLALVKKAIERRGGRIWIESDPAASRGAAFHFTWPLQG